MIRLGDSHQRAQSQQLGGEDPFAERKQSVVDATLVAVARDRPRFRLVDHAFRLEAPDVSVKVSGFECDAAFGMSDDVLANPIAVPLPGAQHREHQQLDGFERKPIARIAVVALPSHGWYPVIPSEARDLHFGSNCRSLAGGSG